MSLLWELIHLCYTKAGQAEAASASLQNTLYATKNNTIAEIMQMTGFRSRNTFYKYVVKYVVNGDRVNA